MRPKCSATSRTRRTGTSASVRSPETSCTLAERAQLVRRLLVGLARREAERETVAEQALGDRAADAFVRAGDECDSHTKRVPAQRRENPRRLGGVSSSAGAGWPFSRRRRSISSDAAAPEGGNSSPSRSQSAAARA